MLEEIVVVHENLGFGNEGVKITVVVELQHSEVKGLLESRDSTVAIDLELGLTYVMET
ncbi:hypothetical protein AM10699_44540 [Acaryochloris marina MBIC10699]|nr:hypothetical protein AM10699_44540 [Acaryochloris marina MBIC10699]